VEDCRKAFISPLPAQLSNGNNAITSSAVMEIITLLLSTSIAKDEYSGASATSLAILMNICVASASSSQSAVPSDDPDMAASLTVPLAVFHMNGLKVAESTLGLTKAAREAKDPLILSRTVGVLARLSVLTAVRKRLQMPTIYRSICRALADNIASITDRTSTRSTSNRNHFLEEQSHLVRILAGLDKPDEACREVAFKEHLVTSLLAVFPCPRQIDGEITPESVTLAPANGCGSPILLGNAARCLMPYADDSLHAHVLFGEHEYHGIEKLICSMANCADMRVRKNIAILLAKGCKVSGVRERIEKFRGMQILRELQDKL